VSNELQRLTHLMEGMSHEHKRSLVDFAEYLKQKSQQPSQKLEPEEKLKPLVQPRPDEENIINAIKRLRASFFMLNTDVLLNETSSLMTQHIVQGRDAVEVIDDLETLFDQHYQNYLQS